MNKKYWYELTLRGISPGCQPTGFIDKNFEYGQYGAIAYNRELTLKEINEYELTPITDK